MSLRILWLKTELLHPVDRGGRIRTYQMLRALRRSHDITYLAFVDESTDEAAIEQSSEYAQRLIQVPHAIPTRGSTKFFAGLAASAVSSLPYVVWRCRSAQMEREVTRLAESGAVELVISDFLFPSVNVPERLPVPTLLFQHNVEAMIWKRHVEVATNPVKRKVLETQWNRMRRWEGRECRRFGRVVAVSDKDRQTFETKYGCSNVAEVPTGVDTDFFRPTGAVAPNPHELVFTGAMDWLPNEDGMAWFVEHVLPLVRRSIPDATLTIVGRRPSARVKALAQRNAAVTVTGGVPDVRPYLERAAAFVVPLRIGGGTRLKIYEAMAMEKAVVSTTIGAEGLPVRDGRHIVLADEPEPFARSIVELLQHPDRARALGDAAAAVVRENFGWDRVADRFADICARLIASPARDLATLTATVQPMEA